MAQILSKWKSLSGKVLIIWGCRQKANTCFYYISTVFQNSLFIRPFAVGLSAVVLAPLRKLHGAVGYLLLSLTQPPQILSWFKNLYLADIYLYNFKIDISTWVRCKSSTIYSSSFHQNNHFKPWMLVYGLKSFTSSSITWVSGTRLLMDVTTVGKYQLMVT